MLDKKYHRIWLIGGTSESRELAIALVKAQIPCLVSVTTETARSLYPCDPLISIWVGKINAADIQHFFQQQAIVAILDASHPFAREISQLAIAAAEEFQLPYLRYERPNSSKVSSPTICLDSFETLVTGDRLTGHRVLLTIGYRHLSLFSPWQKHCTLFARILPSINALQAALDAGFTPDRIVAIRPPLTLDFERSLLSHWQISMVVAKASGQAGGEQMKRQLARELNIQLVIIKRPQINYPQQTSDLLAAVNFSRQAFI